MDIVQTFKSFADVHDVDGICSLLADDVEWKTPLFSVQGREATEKKMKQMFGEGETPPEICSEFVDDGDGIHFSRRAKKKVLFVKIKLTQTLRINEQKKISAIIGSKGWK